VTRPRPSSERPATATVGEPSPLDRFRMRAAAERAGLVGRLGSWSASVASSPEPEEHLAPGVACPVAGREVLTRDQAASLLQVCNKTVSRLVERQGLPAVRIGREYRIRRSALLKWMEEREAKKP
jgi:excisionase family DNA binding protein